MGKPSPPKNPVVAGLMPSIASMLGSDAILITNNSSNNNCCVIL